MPDDETDSGQRKETSGQKEEAAIALEVKVPEHIEVQCCGKWCQD